ncbi:MAG: beta-galactosidase, partial [Fusobacteriaceae bacterium]
MSFEFEDNFLENPEIFAINRLESHSDHKYFQSLESLEMGDESLKKSLNGVWKMSYAKNPELRVKNFYEKRFDVSAWDTVKVPGHVEMQRFGEPQYVNTMYPWDGHEQIIPPMIPKDFNPVSSYV